MTFKLPRRHLFQILAELDEKRVDSAFEVIDATGKIVTPGLVDLHAHVFRGVTYWGVDADAIGPRTGVTTWIDAGSAGALTLEGFREFVIDRARVRIYPFLNISCIGLVAENYELTRLEWVDPGLFRRLARSRLRSREAAGIPHQALATGRSIHRPPTATLS